MNAFSSLPHSEFEVIAPDGKVRSKGRGVFGPKLVTVFDSSLLVLPGDEIRRRIPNGTEEVFEVVDPKFYEQMHTIPANFQIEVRRKGAITPGQGGHLKITVTGNNSRVNIGSTDNSTNTVNQADVFSRLLEAIERDVPRQQSAVLVEAVREMERSQGTENYATAYQRFISMVADHMTVVAPFIPALGQFFFGA